MDKNIKKKNIRIKRKLRVRSNILGTSSRPRLTIFRSNKHIHAQLIDDDKKVTLVHASDLDLKTGDKTTKSKLVGMELAKKSKEQKITSVVFDRNGYRYHGRVKLLAEGAREGGLVF